MLSYSYSMKMKLGRDKRKTKERNLLPCHKEVKPYWGVLSAGDLEALQNEIMGKWIEQKKLINACNKWDRVEYLTRRNQLYSRFQKEKEERMYQQCICKAEKDKLHRERQMIQERNFAEAMKELKDDEFRDVLSRKQLYDSAPEIRHLEHELRRAYFAKTLYAQRFEAEAKKLEEKMRENEMNEILLEELVKFDAKEEEKAQLREKMKYDYQKELQEQVKEGTTQIVKQREETEKDRKMIDEILATIQQEEIDDLMEKTNKVKLYRSEIDNYLEARKDTRRRERERQKEEEERDKKYIDTKEEQKSAYNKAKEERDKAKEAIIAKAIESMMKAQFEADELEDLRREIYEEELAESVRKKEAEELEKRIRQMKELREAEAEGKRLYAEKVAAEKEEEEQYKQQLMAQFAEDDRLEQLGANKRRQREREHRKKVEEMMFERRASMAQEREKQLLNRHCEDMEEKRRQDLINEERAKLLKEHGPKLLGFLPCGTIKSEEELNRLGEPFITFYKNGAKFREPDPTTIDEFPCEEEIFKNMKKKTSNKNERTSCLEFE